MRTTTNKLMCVSRRRAVLSFSFSPFLSSFFLPVVISASIHRATTTLSALLDSHHHTKREELFPLSQLLLKI
ncbi:unnamed protein product [Meloidogyne enterolobii]|uniref:Uncharacterized protein n=1 Tax=Meloidogyne enterolobii TaxID=390850 RepID=A0ACB1AXK1_MELEN